MSPLNNEMYGGYIVQNYLAKNYDTWEKSGLLIQVGRLGLSQQKL